MTYVRPPAVAGMFYPGDADQLRRQLDGLLNIPTPEAERPVKALVVPHAGYIYSGSVAAPAYKLLAEDAHRIRRVVLFGPAHRVAFPGIAATSAEFFATPLGQVRIDPSLTAVFDELPSVSVFDAAHRDEHSLEVQLPFLQRVLGDDFALVPLVVGITSTESVAEVMERLWGGPETLIMVSTDLSHFHDYATARSIDHATSQAIERLDVGALNSEQACGCTPLGGLLLAAASHQLRVNVLDLRNSGDTAGDRARVVGYGTYALH